MNLHDIVKRRDRIMHVESGAVELAHRSGPGGFVGARVAAGTRLRFVDVRRYAALRHGAPLGWEVFEGQADIVEGDDEIIIHSEAGAIISSGGFWNSRAQILPFALGDGLEVGPGQAPHVKPSASIRVRYLENVDKDEWLSRYHLEPGSTSDAVWENYLVGDAQELAGIRRNSLDFIYSSHVFEHLMNPLGVLARWASRLRPGGSALAVVPDCRYCFDLRQEPSTLAEFIREYAMDLWTPPREKYDKWCEGTMLGADPEGYMQRNYPIHFHYYTPSVFGQLGGKAIELGLFSAFNIWGEPNAKDFAVRLVR